MFSLGYGHLYRDPDYPRDSYIQTPLVRLIEHPHCAQISLTHHRLPIILAIPKSDFLS